MINTSNKNNNFDNKESNVFLSTAIYLRLSDEDHNKINNTDDSESIKNQRNILLEEISKHDNWILYDEYLDEDLSGAGTYRPEFERLIKDCKNGKIDIVLCKSQSRFSRDMEIIEKYLHNMFIEWNVRFISFTDNADTNNLGNKKSRQINGLVNEWYLEDLSNNIRSAFDIKMRKGEYISPFAPYGYIINPNNNNELLIDEDVKNIVKEIFNLYLKGFGYGTIAKVLNCRDIPCPSLYKYLKGYKLNIITTRNINDIKWNHNSIKTILLNEVYIGNLIQGKRSTVSYKNRRIIKKPSNKWIRINNTHEAIIDIETWNRVQIIIKNKTRPLKHNGIIHIFSKKVICSICNCYLNKNSTKKNDYLICTSHKNGYECNNKRSIRYDLLENIILNEFNIILSKFFDEDELIKNKNRLLKSNYQNIKDDLIIERNKLLKKKVDKDNYFKTLYKDRVDGIITTEEFITLRNQFQKDNDYKELICDINKKIISLNYNTYVIFDKYKHFSKLNKVIVDEFIDRIIISSLDNVNSIRTITIKWNFNL